MPQKGKFTMRSSKSTSETPLTDLDTLPEQILDRDIQWIKGVGPKFGACFKAKGFKTLGDLIHFFPVRYEKQVLISSLSQALPNQTLTAQLKLNRFRRIPASQKRTFCEASCQVVPHAFLPVSSQAAEHTTGYVTDHTTTSFPTQEELVLKWFHPVSGLSQKMTPGVHFLATGTLSWFNNQPQMVHPELTWLKNSHEVRTQNSPSSHELPELRCVIPIYPEVEGIQGRILRKIIFNALEHIAHLPEVFPEPLLRKRHLLSKAKALTSVHLPPDVEGFDLEVLNRYRSPAHQRLIYEEFFQSQALLSDQQFFF